MKATLLYQDFRFLDIDVLFTDIKTPECGKVLKSISNTEIHLDLTRCHSPGINKFHVHVKSFQKIYDGDKTDIPIRKLAPGTQYSLEISSVVFDQSNVQISPQTWTKVFSTSKLQLILQIYSAFPTITVSAFPKESSSMLLLRFVRLSYSSSSNSYYILNSGTCQIFFWTMIDCVLLTHSKVSGISFSSLDLIRGPNHLSITRDS